VLVTQGRGRSRTVRLVLDRGREQPVARQRAADGAGMLGCFHEANLRRVVRCYERESSLARSWTEQSQVLL